MVKGTKHVSEKLHALSTRLLFLSHTMLYLRHFSVEDRCQNETKSSGMCVDPIFFRLTQCLWH